MANDSSPDTPVQAPQAQPQSQPESPAQATPSPTSNLPARDPDIVTLGYSPEAPLQNLPERSPERLIRSLDQPDVKQNQENKKD